MAGATDASGLGGKTVESRLFAVLPHRIFQVPFLLMRGLYALLLLMAATLILTQGCYRGQVHHPISLQGMGPSPKILADYQPWFGSTGHINVGYSTLDPAVLRKQIQKAREMGIYAFAIDWYGDRRPFEDRRDVQHGGRDLVRCKSSYITAAVCSTRFR